MSADFDEVLNVAAVPDELLLDDLKNLIIDADAEKPRSLQRTPGPSEVGNLCRRKLAYGAYKARHAAMSPLLGINKQSDPLAAIMGTAMHTWMEDALKAYNLRHGRIRFLPETRVTIRPGLSGTCDCLDLDTMTSLDWKFPGSTRYAHYVKHGPSVVYRSQAHLYCRGWRNLGIPVEHAGIVFISRVGTLRQMHLWREPYNPELVDEILARLDSVDEQMAALKVDEDPSGFLQIPITPDSDCRFCNYWSPNPTGPFQCSGEKS